MKLSQTRIAIVLAVLVATSSGCGVINRIRSKNQLNEAARSAKADSLRRSSTRERLPTGSEQQDCSDVYCSHDPCSVSPGRADSGECCQGPAGDRCISADPAKNPQDEEAYKAIAYLYGAIKEDDKLRQWITARRQRVD